MRALRDLAVAGLVAALVLVASKAESEEAAAALGPSLGATLPSVAASAPTSVTTLWITTTLGGFAALGGTVVLVMYLAKIGPWQPKDGGTTTSVEVRKEDLEKAAGNYLRELGPSLTESIATGRGPLIHDWARALDLPKGHEHQLATVIHANRAELLTLAEAAQSSDERAGRFFSRLSELVNDNAVLRSDMDSLRGKLLAAAP